MIVVDEAGELVHHLSTYAASAFSGKISDDFIFDFAEDKDGNIYVATSGKGLNLVRFKEKQLEVIHAPGKDLNSFAKALCVATDGSVWVATSGNGLYRYRPASKEWQLFGAPGNISHPIVTDVAEDRDGKIWISTDGGGLNFIDPVTEEQEDYMFRDAGLLPQHRRALLLAFRWRRKSLGWIFQRRPQYSPRHPAPVYQ